MTISNRKKMNNLSFWKFHNDYNIKITIVNK